MEALGLAVDGSSCRMVPMESCCRNQGEGGGEEDPEQKGQVHRSRIEQVQMGMDGHTGDH